MATTFHLRQPIDWSDSLVLVAFPTAGNAGNIAGHYLRKHLSLPLLGSIHIDGAPGIVAVEDGIATTPLRIFGGEVECVLGEGRCPSVYLIVTDLPLDSEGLEAFTTAITEETKGCKLVLCLDAVARAEGDDTPDVYAAAPDPEILKVLLAEHVSKLPGGILVGMSGHMLTAAEVGDLPGGALLVEATKALPDGHAAAELVKAIDHLIPQVKVDPEPLQKEAEELEKMVQQAQQKVADQERRGPFSSYI